MDNPLQINKMESCIRKLALAGCYIIKYNEWAIIFKDNSGMLFIKSIQSGKTTLIAKEDEKSNYGVTSSFIRCQMSKKWIILEGIVQGNSVYSLYGKEQDLTNMLRRQNYNNFKIQLIEDDTVCAVNEAQYGSIEKHVKFYKDGKCIRSHRLYIGKEYSAEKIYKEKHGYTIVFVKRFVTSNDDDNNVQIVEFDNEFNNLNFETII